MIFLFLEFLVVPAQRYQLVDSCCYCSLLSISIRQQWHRPCLLVLLLGLLLGRYLCWQDPLSDLQLLLLGLGFGLWSGWYSHGMHTLLVRSSFQPVVQQLRGRLLRLALLLSLVSLRLFFSQTLNVSQHIYRMPRNQVADSDGFYLHIDFWKRSLRWKNRTRYRNSAIKLVKAYS